jgi:large subunit ribosomal protein L9
MKVILTQTVPKVGKQGTVVNVADGFARNFLFPRSLAIVADRKQLAALEKRNARVVARTAGEKASAETLRDRINGSTIRIPAQVGADRGKLFGAITSQDVHDAIKAQLSADIDRKHIALIEPIKRLGTYQVELDLHREVDAKINVEVYDPTAPVAAAAPAESEAADDDGLES